jgi:hypothetical protein
MHRGLGVFVLSVAAVQLVSYAVLTWGPDAWAGLYYFDPRIGWAVMETLLRGSEVFPGISSWCTVAVGILIGLALLRNSGLLKAYVVAEGILAVPTLGFIGLVIVRNVGSAHGFSIGELAVPVAVFFLVSVLPVTVVIMRRGLGHTAVTARDVAPSANNGLHRAAAGRNEG